MRWSGGIDRACKLAGVVAIAFVLAACSRHNPTKEYGLGGEGPATPGTKEISPSMSAMSCISRTTAPRLTGEAQGILRNQARWLNQYPQYTITIEGHADERGTREYNLALGARRATTVKAFLAQSGVNAARIRTVSYGKERPVATCDAPSCWTQNRRAQTILNDRGGAVARQLLVRRRPEPQFGPKRPGKCVMVRRVRRSLRSAAVRATLTARSLRGSIGFPWRSRTRPAYALTAGLLLGLAALPALPRTMCRPPRRPPSLSRR